MNLGEFILNKRLEKNNLSSRQLAIKLQISPAYMADLEKGKRTPSKELIIKLINVLELDEDETDLIYDLVAFSSSKNCVSLDISKYIMSNKDLRKCIRLTKNEESSDVWTEILEFIKSKKEGE